MTNKGGRGMKSPYRTVHIRIPQDIRSFVELVSQSYKVYTEKTNDTKINNKSLYFTNSKLFIVFNHDEVIYIGQTENESEVWNNSTIINSIPYLKQQKNLKVVLIDYRSVTDLQLLKNLLIRDLQPKLNSELMLINPLYSNYLKSLSEKTTTIRIPEAIAIDVMEYIAEAHINKNSSLWESINNLESNIEKLEREKEELLDQLRSVKSDITYSSKIFSRKKASELFVNSLSSKRIGDIKNNLAKLGSLLGFQIERDDRKQWIVYEVEENL